VERNTNNGATAAGDGASIALGGTSFAKGLGVSAPSLVIYRLAKGCTSFKATVGVDDATMGAGSVRFRVLGDDEVLFDSERMVGGDPPKDIDVSVAGKVRLKLLVTNGDDPAGQDPTSLDRASWGDPELECGD
jgi:beta-galactosidase